MKKMEAKELRIGNIVKYENTVYLHGGKITEVDNIIQGETDYYEPIPLTEEWLLNFGIKNANFVHEIKHPIVHIYSINKWFFAINEDGSIRMIHPVNEINIKYVHQLQNLYFALTGTELEYDEKK